MLFMDNSHKNVLPFPANSVRPPRPEMAVQIGDERFAIRWEIEELPTEAPALALRKEPKSASKNPEAIQIGTRRKA